MTQHVHDHDQSHGHSHSHDHTQGHHHAADEKTMQSRVFKWGITLNLIYVFVEAFYGFQIQSLALIADAVHNFGDVCGLLLAWLGFVLLSQKPTKKMTFGLKKFSLFAAFLNSVFLIVSSFWVIKEAIERFQNTAELTGVTMMVVAAIGVVINFATALLFYKNSQHDLNMKAAFLHLMGDAAVSAGVIIAGLIIYFNGPVWVDPVSSIVIAIVILATTWGIFKESFLLILDGVPQKVKSEEVKGFLLKQKGISEVHHLHIWAVSASETMMIAHLVMPEGHPKDEYLAHLRHEMSHHFGIHRSTFQIEINRQNCD